LSNLGSLLCARGKLGQAERYHKRALDMKEKLLGRNHVEVALTLNNLAVLYKTQGRFDSAAELYRKALSRLESTLSSRHPNLVKCRKNYAALLKTRKKQMPSRLQRASVRLAA